MRLVEIGERAIHIPVGLVGRHGVGGRSHVDGPREGVGQAVRKASPQAHPDRSLQGVVIRVRATGQITHHTTARVRSKRRTQVRPAVWQGGPSQLEPPVPDVGNTPDGTDAPQLAFDGEIPVLHVRVDQPAVQDIFIGTDPGAL